MRHLNLSSNRDRQPNIDLSVPRHEIHMTKQERCISELICKGYTNREIGEYLSISNLTSRNYVSRLLRKFEARNRTELLAKIIMLHRQHHRKL